MRRQTFPLSGQQPRLHLFPHQKDTWEEKTPPIQTQSFLVRTGNFINLSGLMKLFYRRTEQDIYRDPAFISKAQCCNTQETTGGGQTSGAHLKKGVGSSFQTTFPYQDSRASGWPIQNKQWSLTVLCASRHRLFKDASTGKAAWELERQPLRFSMPSKLLALLGNSLRPCTVPRVKSSLHLGDIGSQVERREQRRSLQSCSALPDSLCSGFDANERTASRMAAGLGELCLLSGYS